MARIAGRLFSQQPFARNCDKYANNRRHSAKMRMNALLSVRVECLRFKKVKAKKSLDFNIFFALSSLSPSKGWAIPHLSIIALATTPLFAYSTSTCPGADANCGSSNRTRILPAAVSSSVILAVAPLCPRRI